MFENIKIFNIFERRIMLTKAAFITIQTFVVRFKERERN